MTVDVLVLTAALALALLPVLPAYGVAAVVPAIAGGLVLGAGVAVVAARRRWPTLLTLAAVVVVFLVAGGPLAAPSTTLAGVVPTGRTLTTLVAGAVTAWKESVTLDPPLGALGGVLVAPFLLALGGSALAASIALRVAAGGRAALAALVPPAVGVVALLLGTKEPVLGALAGASAVILLATWAAWRRGTLQARRVLTLALLVGVVGASGVVVGPLVAAQHPRYVLRDEITPPFDPRDYPSPLAGYRRYVKEWKDAALLTVRGLPAGTPVRIATMDAYDGVVWNVSDGDAAEGSGAFRRVGATLPRTLEGQDVSVEVEVLELPGVWLPTVGEPTSITIGAAGTSGPARTAGSANGSGQAATSRTAGAAAGTHEQLRFNDATGAAVLTGGLREGLRYTVDAVVPEVPTDEDIGEAEPGRQTLPRPSGVPDVVPLLAGEIAGTASSPVEIARALEAGLVERGWFSHGLTDAGDHPSLSGHGADRMTTLLSGELMVGDSEQYASAMALMARELGLPSRVVLGFWPDDEAVEAAAGSEEGLTLTGDDAQAWVEVAFAGHGWVPFRPTPDESKTPTDETPVEQSDPQPQVMQPPPPPADPVTPPEDDTEQPQTQDPEREEETASSWRRIALVAAAASVPLVLLLGPAAVLALLRRRRRRRRRLRGDGVARVVGGWDEVLDAARDLKHPGPAGRTRRETAAELADRFGDASRDPLAVLATGADAVVFGPGEPADDAVERYWSQVARTVAAMRAGVPRRRRLRARWSASSLRHRRRLRRAAAKDAARARRPGRDARSAEVPRSVRGARPPATVLGTRTKNPQSRRPRVPASARRDGKR
ncbi:transglutaminase-like domain-containing protein [Cellulomonas fimi]|uniref:transglutaminase-like domain-containing protein n=1 Tax=Cellulomonas fimi TaxID=1708 RepID=UPI002892B139|nr:transglutaminase-like domain-containing protein [Cellulomonas fimi]